MVRTITITGLAAGVLPLFWGSTALAQDDGAFDRTPQDCITVSRIDQTEALDDQNILFRLRGNQVYRNTLPRKCPGLERENRISYRTSVGRLCSIDTITVLEQFGVGFRDGFTCRLGQFVPLSPAEVEELEALEDGRAARGAIQTSEVDVESAEDEAAEADGPPPEEAADDDN